MCIEVMYCVCRGDVLHVCRGDVLHVCRVAMFCVYGDAMFCVFVAAQPPTHWWPSHPATTILHFPTPFSPCIQEHRNATLDLICHLAVAQGAITHGVLELLCASIVPPPSPPTPEQLAAVGQPWAMAPEIAHVQDAIVTSLTKVLQLVPTAASRVATTLAHSFPHKLRDRDAQCAYLRGILSLAEGPSGGGLRDTMLAAIIDHVLTIDVEIKWEDIVDPAADVAAEEGHSSDDEVFELEEGA